MSAGVLQATLTHLHRVLGGEIERLRVAAAVVGVFFTGVRLKSGHAGVAATPVHDFPEAVCCPKSLARMPQAGSLSGRPVSALLSYAADSNPLKRVLAVAAINAVTHYLWDKAGISGYHLRDGLDALEETPIDKGTRVVLVGAFTPFIHHLKGIGADLVILEKNPLALKQSELKYYRPPAAAAEVLSHCEVAILTGATLVNGTIDELLTYTSKSCRVILAGPTASMFPLPLFKRGVKMIGGIRILDPEQMVQILAEGGSGYHLMQRCAVKVLMTPIVSSKGSLVARP